MARKYAAPREHFFLAIKALATSSDSIQTRLIEATRSISLVTLDEFDGDRELRIKLARILDHIGPDQDDIERVVVEITPYMTEREAEKVADLIFDFFDELDATGQRQPGGDEISFFTSSNGDSWSLVRDGQGTELTVIHLANQASGGAETRWSVNDFVTVAGDHPQGQALRNALSQPDDLENEQDATRPSNTGNTPTRFPWAR